ncbi:CPXCG motif-containing cysteine-rich protein [Pseudoxanthomonas sp. z9]|uniref:CPXCG motif-containing cysteine-rich protein n=1 Tax=Pseudoxanthomonas sp. z9 TaxID=2584942 RepID=UPI00114434A5|nr:CPXCG motif-containing cysteine-rich protein [Pseudoxanthomonas sp. z9]MCL6713602.1 CPXCG motif-containing cysteine-rich protein [Pseudomonas sp. R2.Fl]
MPQLPSTDIACPYCGEMITLFVDDSAGEQDYVEDCQVCCRPIEIRVRVDEDGVPAVSVQRQDDA